MDLYLSAVPGGEDVPSSPNTFIHISSQTFFNAWPHKLHQVLLLGISDIYIQLEVIYSTESLLWW